MTKKEFRTISEYCSYLGSIKTEKKAAASRLNGCKPCKPGKKRGRPKNVKNDLPEVQVPTLS